VIVAGRSKTLLILNTASRQILGLVPPRAQPTVAPTNCSVRLAWSPSLCSSLKALYLRSALIFDTGKLSIIGPPLI
jgi:hypothetical protein